MNRTVPFLLLGLFATAAHAQNDLRVKDLSSARQRYHAYRLQMTGPPFALAKVQALIKGIRPKKGGDEDTGGVLATAAWSRMSTAEKFTYSMLHGEDSSQNCSMMPWLIGEEHEIPRYPTGFFGNEVWSKRQLEFLNVHRDEVVGLLRKTMQVRHRVGANLKDTITFLHANELIPDLIAVYKRDHKDQDILSVLAVLMKDGKYAPFLASTTYKKLYDGYGPVPANPANQKFMCRSAMAFYRTRVH